MDREWRGIGWSAALNSPARSKKFFRSLSDEDLVAYRQSDNEGCVGVNAGRAYKEERKRYSARLKAQEKQG